MMVIGREHMDTLGSWQVLPLRSVLRNDEKVLMKCSVYSFTLYAISSSNHLPLQATSKASRRTVWRVSCWVAWPNPSSLHRLTVLSRVFWYPTSGATEVHEKSLVLCSLYEILRSILRDLFSDAWNLLSVLAGRVHVSPPYIVVNMIMTEQKFEICSSD